MYEPDECLQLDYFNEEEFNEKLKISITFSVLRCLLYACMYYILCSVVCTFDNQ